MKTKHRFLVGTFPAFAAVAFFLVAGRELRGQAAFPTRKTLSGEPGRKPSELTLPTNLSPDLFEPKKTGPLVKTNQAIGIGATPPKDTIPAESRQPVSAEGGGIEIPSTTLSVLLKEEPTLRKALVEMLEARFRNSARREQMEIARTEAEETADHQLRSSQMSVLGANERQTWFIFWVAHGLLLVGVGSAFWEFWRAGKLLNDAREVRALRLQQPKASAGLADQTTPVPQPQPKPQDELQISLDGITIKTAMRGMWLLMMALAFYFLYLKFVYTVTPVQL